jgi:hypothetical protein
MPRIFKHCNKENMTVYDGAQGCGTVHEVMQGGEWDVISPRQGIRGVGQKLVRTHIVST